MIFGIDYGTTHSSISIYYNNNIELLKKNGQVKFDSTIFIKDNIFYFDKNENLKKIRKIKRYINNISMTNDDVKIENYTLKNLISSYFDYLISIIKQNFPNEEIKLVISVPSYFNHHQRNFLKNIWLEKGIDVIRIISEPSSAVMGYYYYYPSQKPIKKVMTFDEGGGTLDISILEKDEEYYEVIDHEGDLYLGGEDFTEEISKFYQIDFNDAEKLKLENKIENIESYKNNLDKIENIILKLKSRHDFDEIDEVIMVGRGSKLIGIKKLLNKYLPDKIKECNEQDNLVILGLGLYGELLNPERTITTEMIMVDSTPLSIGIETADKNFSIIIPKNNILPASGTRKYLPSEDDDMISIKIYQGEKGYAEDNALIEIIELPANPNVFIDSIYKITLKLDLNGIIFLQMEDINDKTYSVETILKHKKISDIEKYQKTDEDIENYNKRSELFLLKQLISRIKSNLTYSKMEDDDKLELEKYLDNVIEDILNRYELNIILRYKKEIEEEYGHLQYHNEAEEFHNEKEDYSTQWKKDYLKSKLTGYLDIITLSDSLKDLIKTTLEKYDNLDVDEIENRIDMIDESLSYNNYYNDLKELIYYLEYQIKEEPEFIDEKNIKNLEEEINHIKSLLENENINEYDWEKILDDFNTFCENIV